MKNYITDGGRVGAGFMGETNDCVVRAYSTVKQIPYSEAHRLFSQAGRKHGQGCAPYICAIVLGSWTPTNQTVATFIARFPRGRFWVCTKSHAFAIIDGVVFDDRIIHGNKKLFRYKEIRL